ncbi:TetR-like C-terminal domain-containing protein [Streptomyces sp. NPDC086554]|uniref:TetR-like C-terminal domain-containing protein n=1 Tax=Streptomyces sp. NPDC086554 TaxID=3154864 RepID=UPI0034368878
MQGREPHPLPDTGSLHGDLIGLANVVLAAFSDPVVIAAERAEVSGILQRAFARGELAVQADPALVHAAVLGTTFAWIFLLGQPPSPELAARIAGLTAVGLTGGS